MANKTVEVQLATGYTGALLKLFDRGGDTLLNTGGDVLTERTNAKGLYTCTVTEALSGYYRAIAYLSDGVTPIFIGRVYLVDSVGTYYVVDDELAGVAGGPTTALGLASANLDTQLSAIPAGSAVAQTGTSLRVTIAGILQTVGTAPAGTLPTSASLEPTYGYGPLGRWEYTDDTVTIALFCDTDKIRLVWTWALASSSEYRITFGSPITSFNDIASQPGFLDGSSLSWVLISGTGVREVTWGAVTHTTRDQVLDAGVDLSPGTLETLEAIERQTDKITTAFLTVLSPVGRRALEVVKGDSYINAEGRGLDFPMPEGANWPTDLTGYTITFKATKTSENLASGDASLTKVGSIVTPTGSSRKVRVELLATDTDGLAVGVGTKGYRYQIVATLTGGHEATLIKGLMTVLEKDTL